MRFEKGNTIGRTGGRPKGSRNAFDAYTYKVVLAHMQHKRGDPVPAEYAETNLWKALDVAFREGNYARWVVPMLPKQVSFENVTARELADEELAGMISDFRERLFALREERSLDAASQMELVVHVG